MKLIVAGGRDFDDKEYMFKCLSELVNKEAIPDNPQLVCGMARGADMLAYNMWTHSLMTVHKFPANWDKYGKSAGYIRNQGMAAFADVLVAFWDGKSRGTKHMIDIMSKLGKPVYVFKY